MIGLTIINNRLKKIAVTEEDMHGLKDLWAFEDFLEIDTTLHALPFIKAKGYFSRWSESCMAWYFKFELNYDKRVFLMNDEDIIPWLR